MVCLRWFKVGLLSGLLHAAVGPTYRFAKIPFLFLDFYVKMKRSRGIGRSDKTVMFNPLWGLNPSLIAAPNLWCGTSGQASRNLSASRLQSLNPDWLQIEWKRVRFRDEHGFADALVLTLVRQDLKISGRCIGGLQFPLEGAAWCQSPDNACRP